MMEDYEEATAATCRYAFLFAKRNAADRGMWACRDLGRRINDHSYRAPCGACFSHRVDCSF